MDAEWHGGQVAELTAVWGGATTGEQEASKGLAMVARLAAAKPRPRQDHGILCMHVYGHLGLVGWIFDWKDHGAVKSLPLTQQGLLPKDENCSDNRPQLGVSFANHTTRSDSHLGLLRSAGNCCGCWTLN